MRAVAISLLLTLLDIQVNNFNTVFSNQFLNLVGILIITKIYRLRLARLHSHFGRKFSFFSIQTLHNMVEHWPNGDFGERKPTGSTDHQFHELFPRQYPWTLISMGCWFQKFSNGPMFVHIMNFLTLNVCSWWYGGEYDTIRSRILASFLILPLSNAHN